MKEATRVIVHVAAWQARAYLPDFLSSLDAQTVREVQTLVVGDAHVPDRLGVLHDVMTLRQFHQPSFVRAHNAALAFSAARLSKEALASHLIVIAHPDVVFDTRFVEAICAAFDADPTMMVGVPVLRRARFSLAEDIEFREVERDEQIDRIGYVMTRGRELQKNTVADPARVFSPSEACAVFRASALFALGTPGSLLDEPLGEAQSIVDVVWRLRARGGGIRIVEEAIAWHHGHESVYPSAWWRRFWSEESRAARIQRRTGLLSIKHDALANRLAHAPWILFVFMKRWVGYLFDPVSYLRILQMCAYIPQVWRARRALAAERTIPPAAMRRWMV